MNARLIVRVGSTSIHKVEPVRRVFKMNVPAPAEILGIACKTGVSEQPYGMEETMRGAINRAEAVWLPGTIAIGIEGGLIDLPLIPWWKKILSKVPFFGKKIPITYLCMAVVVMKDYRGKMYFATSAGMQFPSDEIAEAKKLGVTVGDVLAKKYGGDPTDPRYTLSFGRVHRSDSIEEAIKLVIFNVF